MHLWLAPLCIFRPSWWCGLSEPVHTYSYTLKCLSARCWGCKNEVKVVEDLTTNTVDVYDAPQSQLVARRVC